MIRLGPLPSHIEFITFLFPSKVLKEPGTSRAVKEESLTKSSANDGNQLVGFKKSPRWTYMNLSSMFRDSSGYGHCVWEFWED